MSTPGKLELTIKINEFPVDVQTVENGWKQFELDCDGQLVSVKVKPKVFKKLEQAQENYPMWVAAIAGKMGAPTENGFVLNEPNIQVFERKPKEPKEATEPAATVTT
ncbi:MAG: fertility inhibition FinO-like protein [Tolypothrix sp. T3-bin4]|nr:fertility inhibition FinO-like protein [Tolypothrix sp. T3-bin4]